MRRSDFANWRTGGGGAVSAGTSRNFSHDRAIARERPKPVSARPGQSRMKWLASGSSRPGRLAGTQARITLDLRQSIQLISRRGHDMSAAFDEVLGVRGLARPEPDEISITGNDPPVASFAFRRHGHFRRQGEPPRRAGERGSPVRTGAHRHRHHLPCRDDRRRRVSIPSPDPRGTGAQRAAGNSHRGLCLDTFALGIGRRGCRGT